jgi:hypothetical protein
MSQTSLQNAIYKQVLTELQMMKLRGRLSSDPEHTANSIVARVVKSPEYMRVLARISHDVYDVTDKPSDPGRLSENEWVMICTIHQEPNYRFTGAENGFAQRMRRKGLLVSKGNCVYAPTEIGERLYQKGNKF